MIWVSQFVNSCQKFHNNDIHFITHSRFVSPSSLGRKKGGVWVCTGLTIWQYGNISKIFENIENILKICEYHGKFTHKVLVVKDLQLCGFWRCQQVAGVGKGNCMHTDYCTFYVPAFITPCVIVVIMLSSLFPLLRATLCIKPFWTNCLEFWMSPRTFWKCMVFVVL